MRKSNKVISDEQSLVLNQDNETQQILTSRAEAKTSVAIVHDWFTIPGGAEKVVAELVNICPDSEIYTVFNQAGDWLRDVTGDRRVHVSALNRLPGVQHYYRHLLLLAMRAVENFDLSKFDVVVSSSAAVSKGVLTSSDQKHIAYIHSPARYAWDLRHEYLSSHNITGLKSVIAKEILHRFRRWDLNSNNGIDEIVANSDFIRRRIKKVYRRDARVIYPPVQTERFAAERRAGRHFVTAARLVDYKRIDLIVQAFAQRPDLKLVVIGDGPDMSKLRSIATQNIELVGRVSDDEMRNIYAESRAFVFAALEDFGIAPVEAQAAGLPVIALGIGGTAETVNHGRTGILYREQTVGDLLEAIKNFEICESKLTPEACVANAGRFSASQFRRSMSELINS